MKKLLISFAILISTLLGNSAMTTEPATSIEVLPTMTTQSSAQNRIWVGTFQIVWNETIDNIVKKPIEFFGYDSITAQELNKREFEKSNVDKKAYYTKTGIVSPKLKKSIEKGIKRKFNETSDILDMFDFSYQPDKIFVYAMLKKDFKFLNPFDKLSDGYFAQNKTNVKYFGIKDDSNSKLAKNVEVLFYNSNDDFAVKLLTKGKDEVILYRTNDDKTFDVYFKDLNSKILEFQGNKTFSKEDRLRVPDIKLYQETSFTDVEGYQIKDTNFKIDKTIEIVDFRMNNEGVKLKSEAALTVKCMSLPIERGRNFSFNDTFVLFLTEKGQNVPYYAMRVADVEALNKTGRK